MNFETSYRWFDYTWFWYTFLLLFYLFDRKRDAKDHYLSGCWFHFLEPPVQVRIKKAKRGRNCFNRWYQTKTVVPSPQGIFSILWPTIEAPATAKPTIQTPQSHSNFPSSTPASPKLMRTNNCDSQSISQNPNNQSSDRVKLGNPEISQINLPSKKKKS
jgi:hypothetical protein